MFATLLQKELKSILLSPKFPATFAVCAGLLILSISIGIHEYRVATVQYETAAQMVSQELREQSRWSSVNNRTYRKPDPMQIFVAGVNNDIGRWSGVSQFDPVKLRHSAYSDDAIFAIFRFIDFSFIVQVVLSLFAFLFTYDAINGERETGTLALTFSHPVPRPTYLLAKIAGSWLGLVIPLLLPVAIGLLLVVLFQVPFEAVHWLRLAGLLGVSLLYFTFFVTLGVFLSSLTRRSNVSFLLCLVAWVFLILILPRVGVIVAGQAVTVPTVAEVEARLDAYSKDRWAQQHAAMEAKFRERQRSMAAMTKEEREQHESDHMWGWMEQDDAERKQVTKEIDDHGVRLQEDLRNRKALQEQLAFSLSRVSPASAYQLAAMGIAGTDISLKTRYEDALRSYRTTLNAYTEQKQKETGDVGGIRITMDSEKGISISSPRESGTIDLTSMPRFTPPAQGSAVPAADVGIILGSILLAFAGSVAGFRRFDMRS
jgi:ABC-type transport system involved in multi-copper enzyme maturation permease subunit